MSERKTQSDERQGYTHGIGSGQGGAPIDSPVDAANDEDAFADDAHERHFARYRAERLADFDAQYRSWRDAQDKQMREEFEAFCAARR